MNVPMINDPSNKRLIFESPKIQTYATVNMSSVSPNNLSQSDTIKKKSAKPRTKWQEVPVHGKFETIYDAMAYVEEKYPSFRHEGKRLHKIPIAKMKRTIKKNTKLPGTYVEY